MTLPNVVTPAAGICSSFRQNNPGFVPNPAVLYIREAPAQPPNSKNAVTPCRARGYGVSANLMFLQKLKFGLPGLPLESVAKCKPKQINYC
jgi:hypothetical protein